MSTISSKQEKRHGLVDPVYALVFLILILALLLVGPFAGNASSSISGALGALSGAPAVLSDSSEVSFTADQQYWDANCTGGWSSDSACGAIVQRVQSCSISTASAYCSAYDLYLEPFRN
jgi:hypothetical protein